MACDVCGGTGVVWAQFAGMIEEAVPCAACRVPTGYRIRPASEESTLDVRDRELRHMASQLAEAEASGDRTAEVLADTHMAHVKALAELEIRRAQNMADADEIRRLGNRLAKATEELVLMRAYATRLEAALVRAHACPTVRDDGECDGCYVSEVLATCPAETP
jgi:hypothetical protein